MSDTRKKLLIVDDDAPIRNSLAQIFEELGHAVRCAEDGFAALMEIRQEAPDLILSDLNMPGMSGFELLSVVRRRFPAIRVIAMSGAYAGDEIPVGIAADAFYEKGSGMGPLMLLMESMAGMGQAVRLHSGTLAPVWMPKNGHDPAGLAYVTITCPECLRTFMQILDEAKTLVHEAACAHCGALVHYAIVQPETPPAGFRRDPGVGMPPPQRAPSFN
jgi:CheY-like chemotaxis protein